jgi:hypothetical protein
MGVPVLVLGESGSGKSCSLRNFDPNEVGIFNVASKPLPFRKKMRMLNEAKYQEIMAVLVKNQSKCYVIDDAQYLMAFSLFDRANEVGYKKFTDTAVDFYNLVQTVIKLTSEDTIVYFLQHIERDDTGRIKAKTAGKMLDNQLTLEGLFSIVLLCEAKGEEHYFITQSDGTSTAKSPMGLFDSLKIDNDLKMVDDAIRNYYEFGKGDEKND